jgi:hypothetical protein
VAARWKSALGARALQVRDCSEGPQTALNSHCHWKFRRLLSALTGLWTVDLVLRCSFPKPDIHAWFSIFPASSSVSGRIRRSLRPHSFQRPRPHTWFLIEQPGVSGTLLFAAPHFEVDDRRLDVSLKEISIFVADKDGNVIERGVSIGTKIGQRRWDMETYTKAAEGRFTSRINRIPVDGSVLLECRLPLARQRTWRLWNPVAGSGDRPTQNLLS